MTHTTNPLLRKSTIQRGINLFKVLTEEGNNDSIFTVNKVQTRIWPFIQRDGTDGLHQHLGFQRSMRREQIAAALHEALSRRAAAVTGGGRLFLSPRNAWRGGDDGRGYGRSGAESYLSK